jgi:hypothetical protein
MYIKLLAGSLKVRGIEDIGVDGRVILKWFLNK